MSDSIREGSRVVVKRSSRYRSKLDGLAGEVIKAYNYNGSATYGVRIDRHVNRSSATGVFYFTTRELKIEENFKEDTHMEKLENFLAVAEISFLDSQNTDRTYAYACYDPSIEVGDTCVVKSAHHGFGIGMVKALRTAASNEEVYREIVCRADFSAYNNRVEMRAQAEELKALMNERAKKLQDLALYETLAKCDPEMSQLLEKFKALPPV